MTISSGLDQKTMDAFEATQQALAGVWASTVGREVPQEVFARLVALTDAMTKLADELNLPRHQTTQTVVSFWREWQQGESDWVTPEGR